MGSKPRLALIEQDTTTEFKSYYELLEYLAQVTFDICVNSPEEYEALDQEPRDRIDAFHEAFR